MHWTYSQGTFSHANRCDIYGLCADCMWTDLVICVLMLVAEYFSDRFVINSKLIIRTYASFTFLYIWNILSTFRKSFNLCTEYSQHLIFYRTSILNVLPISWCFLYLAHLVLQLQPCSVSLINTRRAHSHSHTVFLSSKYAVFALMATQHFLHQHVWSSHWQPCNGSFINICGAYNNDYAMFLPAAQTWTSSCESPHYS